MTKFSEVAGSIILPPPHAHPINLIPVYRFVGNKSNIIDSDFYPSPFKNMKKLKRITYSQEHEGSFGISFYDDYNVAKSKLDNSCWRNKKEIAKGQILKQWGKCDKIDSSRHINLWKYDNIPYSDLIPHFS